MRLRTLAVALVLLIGIMAFPQLALAAEPERADEVAAESQGQAAGLLNIVLELTFDENGEWVADVSIESPGMKPIPGLPNFIAGNLRFEDQSYASLKTLFGLFGMDMDIPKADPAQVQGAVDAGLASIAIKKTFLEDGVQEICLYANDRLLLAVEASNPVLVEALGALGAGGMEGWLLPLLTESESTVVLHFPTEDAAVVTLEDGLEPSEGPHANMLSLGATVAESDGTLQFVSVAGFSVDEVQGLVGGMGMPLTLPSIPLTILSDYNVEQLTISAGQDGLLVDAGDGRWIRLGWDVDSRAAAVEMLPAVGEFLYWDFGDVPKYLAQAEPWIADTGIELNLYVSGTPQEGTPQLSINEPIVVELADDGGVIVEGYDLGAMGVTVDLDPIKPYIDALPLAVSWDGEDMQLRLSVDGAEMPYFAVNPETLPRVAGLFLSESVPMEKVTAILGDAQLNVAVGLEGTVEKTRLDYEAAGAQPAKVVVIPRLVIDQEGRFGVGDPPMRISTILDGLGIDTDQVQAMARLYALGYGDDLNVIGITLDPAAIQLTVDSEVALAIRWDKAMRQDLLGIVERYYPIPDIPFIENLFPQWKSTVIDAAVGTGWGTWGLEVAIVDELPASPIESTLEAFGLLR